MNNRDFQRIFYSSTFQRLVKQKKKFVIPAVLFFFSFYLMLPLSISLFAEIMNRRFYHLLTWGWGYAFAQFMMVWVLGIIYFYKARIFDRIRDEIENERN
ncbi:DUF485 domain-containing protein [Microaerobacter geothermalis]|uniref:DUF485 domain-containing protein n=1 Tax=Microaerobacter geothermalis TaxID=674972 RepID=UPI001F2EC082|nr:DUF485 domain-containing protein [Microaerobacter geothermalis]MCF6094979.1 DUF485 domain-containing protein [Microaerobacter geothermalis]